MKKILFLIILFLSLFGIYKAFDNPKLNYISIGDSLINGINPYNNTGYGYNDYVKNYLERNNKLRSFNNYYYNNSLKGLTEDIKNNRTIMVDDKEYFLKKLLRESDIIVVSSGMDELSFNYQEDDMKYNYQYFDKMYNDIEELILELKKYSINDIIFIGYYNPLKTYTSDVDEYFCYINEKLSNLMKNNNIVYLDIYEEIKSGDYLDNPKNYHINTNGYLKIANLLLKYLEKAWFNTINLL